MKTQNVKPLSNMASTALIQLAAIRDVGLKQVRRIPLLGPPVAGLLRPKLIEKANKLQKSVLQATVGKAKRIVVKTGIIK